MENKKYTIQGETFKLLQNDLSLLNKAALLIAKLRKLTYEYTKGIDLSGVQEYRNRLAELNEGNSQIEELIRSNQDENGNELSEEEKCELQNRADTIAGKIEVITAEFNSNTSLLNLLKLKEELESYALIELLTDIDFLKPILKKILTGGKIDSLDFSDAAAIGFVRDVVADFFSVMNRNSLKL